VAPRSFVKLSFSILSEISEDETKAQIAALNRQHFLADSLPFIIEKRIENK
jgi:hypothetical protein